MITNQELRIPEAGETVAIKLKYKWPSNNTKEYTIDNYTCIVLSANDEKVILLGIDNDIRNINLISATGLEFEAEVNLGFRKYILGEDNISLPSYETIFGTESLNNHDFGLETIGFGFWLYDTDLNKDTFNYINEYGNVDSAEVGRRLSAVPYIVIDLESYDEILTEKIYDYLDTIDLKPLLTTDKHGRYFPELIDDIGFKFGGKFKEDTNIQSFELSDLLNGITCTSEFKSYLVSKYNCTVVPIQTEKIFCR